jgi:hypothetical protein
MLGIKIDDYIKGEYIDICDSTKYPLKNGSYICDDGVSYYWIVIKYDIATNCNIISSNIVIERNLIMLNDFEEDNRYEQVLNYLDDINRKLDKPKEKKNSDNNIDDLIRLVAVAQNPDVKGGL